jgi:hypothetical protein
MKAGFTSRQLEYSKWSNMLHAHGSPLPRQGEGEGEGLFEGTRAGSETPHLSPLPLSKGRGERIRVGFGVNLGSQNVVEMTRPTRLAIK